MNINDCVSKLLGLITSFLTTSLVSSEVKVVTIVVSLLLALTGLTAILRSIRIQVIAFARGGLNGWYLEVAGSERSVNQRLTELNQRYQELFWSTSSAESTISLHGRRLDQREATTVDLRAEVEALRQRMANVEVLARVETIALRRIAPPPVT